MSFSFTVTHTYGAARRGVLQTAHGVVQTPAFMPVGTQGAVKAITHRDLELIAAEIILANTYHLYLRPGAERVGRLGGLHKFIGWNKPILTDSGGYQVFSLAARRKVHEEGATFRSHLDGSEHLLTPESAVEIQASLGSDIAMVLDECLEYPAPADRAAASVERTLRWARRGRDHFLRVRDLALTGAAADVPGSDPGTARARGTGVRPRYTQLQRVASGFCLAAAIAVKLYPAIFLLLLVRKRRFQDVLIAAAFLAAFVAATLAAFPHALWHEWSTLVISAGGFGRSLPALTHDLAAYNISLNGTLMRLLGPGAVAGRLAIAAGTMMLVWSLVRSAGASRPDVAETATISLVMICAVPIAWAHHLAMVIPLAALSMRSVRPTPLAIAAYAAICFKWDWSFGSVMLGAVAPATAATIALWTQMLPPRQAAVIASAETA